MGGARCEHRSLRIAKLLYHYGEAESGRCSLRAARRGGGTVCGETFQGLVLLGERRAIFQEYLCGSVLAKLVVVKFRSRRGERDRLR